MLLMTALLSGCSDHSGHDHGEHSHGAHKEHDSHHKHGRPELSVTDFTEHTELFVEFPALVVSKSSAFAAHLTWVKNYKPLVAGRVTVVLKGGKYKEEVFPVSKPSQPGIFRADVIPKKAGQRELVVKVVSQGITVEHNIGKITVYPAGQKKFPPQKQTGDDGITFLKEQQWKVNFGTSEISKRVIRETVAGFGVLKPKANNNVHITSPTAGRILTYGKLLPQVGQMVKAGQVLAQLAPKFSGSKDIASLELESQRSQSKLNLAKNEYTRVAGLLKQGAVSQKRVHVAQSQLETARAEHSTAKRRLSSYGRVASDSSSSVNVPAPIAGTLVQIHFVPGSYVTEGQALFQIVNLENIWLKIQIAEMDAGQLVSPMGAWFQLPDGSVYNVDLAKGGKLINFGTVVDSKSRTLPVIFEMLNPDRKLRINTYIRAHVYTGKSANTVVIPTSAIVDDNGQDVVFILKDGEHFERRIVNLGIREGAWAQVLEGVKTGERIVSKGAYLVYLASSATSVPSHGHAH